VLVLVEGEAEVGVLSLDRFRLGLVTVQVPVP